MSSIMRRRRGLKSAISILLSDGDGLQHPHPLSQEAIYATLPLTPRQRLRSIPIQKPDFRQIRSRQNAVSRFQINSLGVLHGRLRQIGDGMGGSIPFACQDWANTKAAYRFFANERV